MTGIHATIVVSEPAGCPVAVASERAGAPVDSVSRSSTADAETIVEEFGVRNPTVDLSAADGGIESDGGEPVESVSGASQPASDGRATTVDAGERGDVDLEPVYATERSRVYRFERDWIDGCVCEVVEAAGTPVSTLRAEDGELHLGVHVADVDALSGIVSDLQDRFDGVSLRELTESGDGGSSDLVLVDRARLTDRQREVLETAHDMGYFVYPKGANAGEVAAEIGVSGSTFAEHMAAAQSKLLAAILEG